MLMESSSRINDLKPVRYWYPLSAATYGVEEVLEAVDSMCSFHTSMGEKTRSFERQFADYQGCAEAVMVNSGSSADLLTSFLLTNPLAPLLNQGDEVIVPVVTWPTQIWSPKMAGLSVRLVDVDPETLNLDFADLERKCTSKTKAIFPVHLMGNPCDMDRLLAFAKERDLIIVEDCCEALGSTWRGQKVGTFGIASAFSFFFSHHLVTMEGGMVCCNDAVVADHLRILRAHGWTRNTETLSFADGLADIDARYAFVNWGFNLRPTELQAGFGVVQLARLEKFNTRRNKLAAQFFSFIDTLEWLQRPKVCEPARPVWFALPLMVSPGAPFTKSDIISFLEKKGIETRPIVAGNIARHPVTKLFLEFENEEFPGADQVHDRGFYIGLTPIVTDEELERLVDTFKSFLAQF
jgi:CDP-4-dehydro-6-deoxyglucose reductase, E1